MSDNNKSFGAFVLGFLFGAIAGGISALLFAPQSGEETRTLIKEKSIDVYDKAGKSLEEAYAQAEAALAEARVKIEEVAAEAKEKSEELTHHGKIMLEKIAKQEAGAEEVVNVEDVPASEAEA
ncbi:MAG: YtxH domain-containing protein [Anaerolineaceae bacterium]|nr:YtxH domain-containing protein [Anaerolineaceae bacterium]